MMGYLDKYYEEGYTARVNGESKRNCPYENGTVEYREWMNGYSAGRIAKMRGG